MHSVIVLPRLHADHALCEVDEIRQCPCHRAENAGYALLAWHASFGTHFWPSPSGAAEGVDAGEVSGHPDGTCDIGADANPATSVGEERTLTSSGSAGGIFGVVWVGCATPDIVG